MKKKPEMLFLLPNLFTISSILCGFYAIIQVTDDLKPDRFFRAAVAILFAVVFDSLDGRLARMTKTQTHFGIQLDSLADVISFGVAPAVLIYHWALFHFGFIGLLVAFVYTACGALRLARFNVLATREGKTPLYSLGVSIPLAATTLVSIVLIHHRAGEEPLGYQPFLMIAVVLILSALMVSNIRYRTFKNVKANRITVPLLFLVVALSLLLAWKTSFGLITLVFCISLISLGPAEELLRALRRKTRGSRAQFSEPDDKKKEVI